MAPEMDGVTPHRQHRRTVLYALPWSRREALAHRCHAETADRVERRAPRPERPISIVLDRRQRIRRHLWNMQRKDKIATRCLNRDPSEPRNRNITRSTTWRGSWHPYRMGVKLWKRRHAIHDNWRRQHPAGLLTTRRVHAHDDASTPTSAHAHSVRTCLLTNRSALSVAVTCTETARGA